MKMVLKRIKKSSFDELVDYYIKEYSKTKKIEIDDDYLEKCSESIIINSQEIEIDIDLNAYREIVNVEGEQYKKKADIGMQLHKDFKGKNINIPQNILYEKEVWAYYTLKYLIKDISKLKMFENLNEDRIKRYVFNIGKRNRISRCGVLFFWCMIDKLDSENDEDFSRTAFQFIDPVKAILERNMSKESLILKAFVQAIINNKKDARFKQVPHKTKMPSFISCYAGVNMLEAYNYEELVDIITFQQQNYLLGN